MSTLFRILVYGVQGFRRNIWLALIAIITMTLTILTISTFGLADLVAAKKYQDFNSKLDYNIFIKDSATDADVTLFRQQVQARPEVVQIAYISKDDAAKKFQTDFGSNDTLKGLITSDNNPLPREVDVKFHDPTQIDSFNTFINQAKFQQIVEVTSYQNNKGLVDNYVRITNFLKVVGLSFTVFFIMIAVLIILNTLRLTIFSRRDEIEVMRLVGATREYIRGPFMIEGIFVGLIGALLSAVLCWGFLYQLQSLLSHSLNQSNIITDLFSSSLGNITQHSSFNLLFGEMLGVQLLIGIGLGTICSFIAIRRYLRE